MHVGGGGPGRHAPLLVPFLGFSHRPCLHQNTNPPFLPEDAAPSSRHFCGSGFTLLPPAYKTSCHEDAGTSWRTL